MGFHLPRMTSIVAVMGHPSQLLQLLSLVNMSLSVALRSEMAEAAAVVIASEGHDNKVYDIVNTEVYSYEDIARLLSEIIGKNINYISPTAAEFTETLRQTGDSIPEEYFGIILAQAQGDGDITNEDLSNLIGRKPTTIKTFLEQVYKIEV